MFKIDFFVEDLLLLSIITKLLNIIFTFSVRLCAPLDQSDGVLAELLHGLDIVCDLVHLCLLGFGEELKLSCDNSEDSNCFVPTF